MPGSRATLGPGSVLGGVVVVMVVVMVLSGSERGAGEDHQQQGKSEKFFHARILAREGMEEKGNRGRGIKVGTGALNPTAGVN
jgi:hypothetical protein